MLRFLLTTALAILISSNLWATNRIARLGIGMSNQLSNGLSAVSFKIQKSEMLAIGGLLGFSTQEFGGGYGAGLKLYKIIFDEPNLTFYSSGLASILNYKTGSSADGDLGFQFDVTLGTEFSFTGLNSLGLSFEFGLSANQLNKFVVETVGYHFVVAGIHFYL
ncbi:MAG: hypothetical protein A2504_15860 [Bdellovibrionales bacterium RIFOXYD12_FULL_39_22]|nr:MAG: hypothetical protein A2385_07770 [Bdellovibrionales bacterium RIFOXYB1_FULL_39_21]OFZ43043.1 MAG: hypothetical protein A2485_11455 [Bdellovibrionales bacterium RIFOXYC12_FULL_39_17]OFZ50871.1 MAG: hypothetical protein A2404_06685 [Bdellovibrionales bacterium RIFOXYC1_FULL_39_130]OFZ71374.1 MAG: hypothetical protein A2451_16270 [Bdellovibrionales bacterium RIFOXYC2_FULL_39_8]OFZ78094.1 MAG: hypothetical protein A2560_01855 [Bdellovibrionales bacterium RIFOXYD1_FULL_39_84]OFZ93962.1 MAG: